MPAFPQQLVPSEECQENWEFLQTSSYGFDTGDIKLSIRTEDHGKWILLDGRAVAPYPDLARVFTAAGGGANLPDARGRTVVGSGTGSGLTNRAHLSSFGEEVHTLTIGEVPSTTMTSATGGSTVGYDQFVSSPGTAIRLAGASGSHNNVQPSLALNYFVHI